MPSGKKDFEERKVMVGFLYGWMLARRGDTRGADALSAHLAGPGDDGADLAEGSRVLHGHGFAHAAFAHGAADWRSAMIPGASKIMVTVEPLVTSVGRRTSSRRTLSPACSTRRVCHADEIVHRRHGARQHIVV